MRLLIWSPAPWAATGFGKVAGAIGPRIAKKHQVAYFIFTHAHNTPGLKFGSPDNPLEVFTAPRGPMRKENQWVNQVRESWGADAVLSIFDWWALPENFHRWAPPSLIAYTPVDAIPLAPQLQARLQSATYIVPMCHWAKSVYEEAKMLVESPILHGVDLNLYKPIPKGEARNAINSNLMLDMNLPNNAFVVGIVARNAADRKNLPAQMKAFYQASIPNSKLFYVGDLDEPKGWNLQGVWRLLAGNDNNQLVYFNGEFAETGMPYVYSSMDVLMNCTYGEGFGFPLIEAGACGVPSIVTDFSSMRELVQPERGYLVSGEVSHCQQILSTWQMIPSLKKMRDTLVLSYERHDDQFLSLVTKGQAMRKWVIENCDWDKIGNQWITFLDKIESDIKPKR